MDTLTGDVLLQMVEAALAALERDKERINALNVFPVPDGDTGTNMALTLRATWEAAEAAGTLSEVAEALAVGALRGARGNSGTILSQFFHGFYQGVKGLESAGPKETAKALSRAAEAAYAAVAEPQEGTILTVGREGADRAQRAAMNRSDLVAVLEAALIGASEAVEETPELLDVLRDAGVVDAGGEALVVAGRGALAILKGEPVAVAPWERPRVRNDVTDSGRAADEPPDHDVQDLGNLHHRFAIRPAHLQFKYCTEFLVKGEAVSTAHLREGLSVLGDCLIVVGGESLAKVHVHTNRPGMALEIGMRPRRSPIDQRQ